MNGKVVRAGWYNGLLCICVHYHDEYMNHLCGYVAVPAGHKYHGKKYTEVCDDGGVHGGLTFSDTLSFDPYGHYWMGFDCNHYCDRRNRKTPGFVMAELEKLAKALNA